MSRVALLDVNVFVALFDPDLVSILGTFCASGRHGFWPKMYRSSMTDDSISRTRGAIGS